MECQSLKICDQIIKKTVKQHWKISVSEAWVGFFTSLTIPGAENMSFKK